MRFACAIAVACLIAAPFAAFAREPIELSVLSYNVHGLPGWIARDDPEARMPLIAEKVAAYDVVLLQEDFHYHELIAANKKQGHMFRGNGPWAAWLEGAGVTILSRYDNAIPPLRGAYGVCNGYLGAANDCLGNKGWLMVRLALPNGAELDVWDTHLDAGASDGDHRARVAQLDLLAAAIEEHGAGRAILVGGDFNLEWDVARDRALLEAFRDRLGLAIAAQAPPDGWPEHLDYLLVRSGGNVGIAPAASGKDATMIDAANAALSDHPAIFARFRIE